jgi:hypothetical protein
MEREMEREMEMEWNGAPCRVWAADGRSAPAVTARAGRSPAGARRPFGGVGGVWGAGDQQRHVAQHAGDRPEWAGRSNKGSVYGTVGKYWWPVEG